MSASFWGMTEQDHEDRVREQREQSKIPCVGCGKKTSHTVGGKRMCCKCYVEAGNAPADWHSECMRTYAKLKKESA